MLVLSVSSWRSHDIPELSSNNKSLWFSPFSYDTQISASIVFIVNPGVVVYYGFRQRGREGDEVKLHNNGETLHFANKCAAYYNHFTHIRCIIACKNERNEVHFAPFSYITFISPLYFPSPSKSYFNPSLSLRWPLLLVKHTPDKLPQVIISSLYQDVEEKWDPQRTERIGSTREDEAEKRKCGIPVKYEQKQRDGRGEKLVEGNGEEEQGERGSGGGYRRRKRMVMRWIHKAAESRVIPRGQRDKGKDEGSVTD